MVSPGVRWVSLFLLPWCLAAVEPFESVLKRLSTTTRQSGCLVFFKTTQNKYEKNEARKNCHGWHVLPSSLFFKTQCISSAQWVQTFDPAVFLQSMIWSSSRNLCEILKSLRIRFEIPFLDFSGILLSWSLPDTFFESIRSTTNFLSISFRSFSNLFWKISDLFQTFFRSFSEFLQITFRQPIYFH